MDTAQIVLAAIAAIGALAAVGIGIAALASSKRPAGADNEQLDRITDNLQEAVQMIKEYTEASDKQTREILVQAIASSNNAMIATLQPYMNTFSKQIDSVLDKIERNLGEIRAQMQTASNWKRCARPSTKNCPKRWIPASKTRSNWSANDWTRCKRDSAKCANCLRR